MSREQAPDSEADSRLRTWGRFTSTLLAFIGTLGLLRTGFSGPAESVALVVVHPLAAVVYLAAGLVGIALATTIAGRRIFGLAGGAALIVWGLLGMLLQGNPSAVFTGDRETVALHLLLGGVGLGLALLAQRNAAPARSA